jgi:hypothetical protein
MKKIILPGLSFFLIATVLLLSCKEETAKTAVSQQPASLSYHEEFDSMQRVIDMGWKAVNLSNPLGADNWQQGSYVADNVKGGPFYSNIGSHSYKVSANEHAFVPYTCGDGLSFINCWLITPPLAMKNGDKISFWTTTRNPVSFPDRMQVWLNPNNDGTNVGRDQNNTGDFTVKLLEINPNQSSTGYPTTWTKYELTISGLPNGSIPKKLRVGFRYYVQGGGPSGSNSDEIAIDDFDFISQ